MPNQKPAALAAVYVVARVKDSNGDDVVVLGLQHGTEPAFARWKSDQQPPYADWPTCASLIGNKVARNLNADQEHEIVDWLRNGPVETLPGLARSPSA